MKSIWQFIKFGLVGVSNTLISEAVYAIMVLIGCNYIIASVTGFVLSVLNAYYWSNKYVFKEREDAERRVWWKVLLKTYVAYIWGFLINLVLLVVWIDVLHVENYMGPVQEFLAGIGIGDAVGGAGALGDVGPGSVGALDGAVSGSVGALDSAVSGSVGPDAAGGLLDARTLGSLIAEGINLIITIPMNFLINKYWAYRQKDVQK